MQTQDFKEIVILLKEFGPDYIYNLINNNNTSYQSIQNILKFTGGASQSINMINEIYTDYINFKNINSSEGGGGKTKYTTSKVEKLKEHNINPKEKISPIKDEYNILNNDPYNKLSRKNFILLTKNMKVIKHIPYVKLYYLDIKKIAKELSKIQKGGDGDIPQEDIDISQIEPQETFEPVTDDILVGGFFTFYLNKYTIALERLEKYSKEIQDWKWFKINTNFLAGKKNKIKPKENTQSSEKKHEGEKKHASEKKHEGEEKHEGGSINYIKSEYSPNGNAIVDTNFLSSYTQSEYLSSSPNLELTLSSNDDLFL